MASASAAIEEAIVDLVESREPLTIEQVVGLLPWVSWREVFLGVEVLSQKGAICLRFEGFSNENTSCINGLSAEPQARIGFNILLTHRKHG